jgi:hypothetical protein
MGTIALANFSRAQHEAWYLFGEDVKKLLDNTIKDMGYVNSFGDAPDLDQEHEDKLTIANNNLALFVIKSAR